MLLGRLWQPETGTGLLAGHGDDRLRDAVVAARTAARAFFGEVGAWVGSRGDTGGLAGLGDGFPVEDALSPHLEGLAEAVAGAAPKARDLDAAMEIGARARQVAATAEALGAVVRARPGEVRWVERGARGAVAIASAPVDVGPLLHEVLWSRHRSVVLTSATLAAGRPPSFAFLRERLGLAEVAEVVVGSPFDYPRQARLRVRRDLPDPVDDPAGYEASLPDAVLEAVRLSRGSALVLFTGYGAMQRTAAAVRVSIESDGLELLVQGESLERPALLDRFRRGGAVLFGVASFWQGVDVPGDALRHVVIARLPFDVPTHPLQVARYDRLRESGRDPFWHLALPVAALRLKQGFGRLVRTATDRGTVTILDPRVLTRSYGRFLLGSLPECPIEEIGQDLLEGPP